MSRKGQRVQCHFHRSAAKFDRLYHETNFLVDLFNRAFRRALYERTQVVLEEILECEAQSVLDVGCGSGVNSVLFAQNGIDRVVGIDFAENMLTIAHHKLPPSLRNNVTYERADFVEWEGASRFDCVVALGVFDYVNKPRQFIEKMLGFAGKKVLFSVPLKGNLRQLVRSIRYRAMKCPLYFYEQSQLKTLMSFDNTQSRFRSIHSSGLLCIIDIGGAE